MTFTIGSTVLSLDHTMGWFTLALINAALAQCKGRSGLSWFLVSCLLGPLATLALLFRDPRH